MNDKMSKDRSLIPLERIERSILMIRSQKVMLDRDLAQLFGVETREQQAWGSQAWGSGLNIQQVKFLNTDLWWHP